MKFFLEEIINSLNKYYIVAAIYWVPIFTGLTIGGIKNYGAITGRHSSKDRRSDGLKNVLFWFMCGASGTFIFVSVFFVACYFSFNLINLEMTMYSVIAMAGFLIGLTFNFKLMGDVSRKKKLKGVINTFIATFAIVIVIVVCDQMFIH